MTKILCRIILLLGSWIALGLGGTAWALTVTDGVTTFTNCTQGSQTFTAQGETFTFIPSGCLSTAPSGNDPVFSIRVVPASTTQPSSGTAGVQTVLVFVDADRDVPTTTTYNLTLNLCTSAQGCTSSGSGNWYFFRYSELGGAGFTPLDQVTTGSFSFAFQPGANVVPANLRSMGVGHLDVLNSPLFSGTRSVMLSLSGTQAQTNVVTHTITGGLQDVSGTDYDIAGNPIPNVPLSTTAFYQCELLGQPGSPGPNLANPCGAYQIPVGECSTGMTGANAIANAYLLQLEDYTPISPRIGNSMRFGLARNAAMVFKFRTGPAGVFPLLPREFGVAYEEQVNRGPSAPRFITVSEKKCDFDYSKVYTGSTTEGKSGCFQAVSSGGLVPGRLTLTGTDPAWNFPYCQIKPDTTYYLNMRWENAGLESQRGVISCPAGENAYNACGTALGYQ